MSYTHTHLPMKLITPLGPDELLLRAIRGQEGISTPFHFELELLSFSPEIPFAALLYQPVAVKIRLPDGSSRAIHGRVSRFSQGSRNNEGMTRYHAEVVPWLTFLELTSACRIFQHLSTQQILSRVFDELGFPDYEFRGLSRGQETREYCVQYRETALNFVNRLLEEEGIFYYFEHTPERHLLVLADDPVQFPSWPGLETARVSASSGPTAEEDLILELLASGEVQTAQVACQDFNFETPSSSLLVGLAGDGSFESYDYPGLYLKREQGEGRARLWLEEHTARFARLRGSSTCRHFTPGYRLTLRDHHHGGIEPVQVLHTVTHEARQAVSLSVTGQADESFHYRNTFTSFPHSVPYRPPRRARKPSVTGSQTAIVVGRKDDEIYCDQYGRVKVQFHWDREGKRDENSSCWIRVAHHWAGKNWGSIFIPRVGQEVIVDFLEGDPDRPIITGRVYNAEQMPPYPLPAEQTKSTIKSNSSKGGQGFNELRFEDRKGAEQIFLHAQRNLDVRVLNDAMTDVGASWHLTVGGEKEGQTFGDAKTKIFRHRHTRVRGDGRLRIEGKSSIRVSGDSAEDYQLNHKTTVAKETFLSSETIILEAGRSITLKGPGGFIKIDAGGVTIVGSPQVKVNSGGSPDVTTLGSLSAEEPEEPAEADNAKSGFPSNR